MPVYTVKQGDYLGRIASAHGFASWKTIYEHPQNADFRKKRPNPDLIYPGDEIFIPERNAKGVPVATGKTHKVEVGLSKHRIKVRVTEPSSRDHFAGRPYVLTLGSKEHRGNIPGSGVIDHELPPHVTKGKLRVLPSTTSSRQNSRAISTLGISTRWRPSPAYKLVFTTSGMPLVPSTESKGHARDERSSLSKSETISRSTVSSAPRRARS